MSEPVIPERHQTRFKLAMAQLALFEGVPTKEDWEGTIAYCNEVIELLKEIGVAEAKVAEQAEAIRLYLQMAEQQAATIAELNKTLRRITTCTGGGSNMSDSMSKVGRQSEINIVSYDDLVNAMRDLVHRLDDIEQHQSYKAVWSIAWVHGIKYDGPNWSEPLKQCKELLAKVHNG